MALRAALLTLAVAASGAAGSKIPLKLAGANCADPKEGLPKFCCQGIIPDPNYAGTCECNPGWSHDECLCKGFLTKNACHQCMVHLPATNRWTKTFTKTELYDNCNDCVDKCKAGMAADTKCGKFMDEVWGNNFPDSEPADVLCTNDYLKTQLMNKEYPLDMKRTDRKSVV